MAQTVAQSRQSLRTTQYGAMLVGWSSTTNNQTFHNTTELTFDMRKYDLTNKKTMTKTSTMTNAFKDHLQMMITAMGVNNLQEQLARVRQEVPDLMPSLCHQFDRL